MTSPLGLKIMKRVLVVPWSMAPTKEISDEGDMLLSVLSGLEFLVGRIDRSMQYGFDQLDA